MAIAKRVRAIAESKQLTQKELAKRMGKQESEVSKWVSGEHNFTLRSLAKLEAALGEIFLKYQKP
jgi:transcriptional regulator with XRE-family HTH domain